MKIKCTAFETGFTVGVVYRVRLDLVGPFLINDEGERVSYSQISVNL